MEHGGGRPGAEAERRPEPIPGLPAFIWVAQNASLIAVHEETEETEVRHGTWSRSRSTGRGAGRGALEAVGARTSASGSGAPCGRTTATTATPGATSATTRPAPAPTSGARTASPASATTTNGCASAIALWNGVDPILKERMFGLTNAEGNHGEDVKEYYFYLDATPDQLVPEVPVPVPARRVPVRRPGRHEPRPEPPRAGVRAARHRRVRRRPLRRRRRRVRQGRTRRHATSASRSPTAASDRRRCTCCPTLWFRNTWWMGEPKGVLRAAAGRLRRASPPSTRISASSSCGARASPTLLFTENETNTRAAVGHAERVALREGRLPRVRDPRARRTR